MLRTYSCKNSICLLFSGCFYFRPSALLRKPWTEPFYCYKTCHLTRCWRAQSDLINQIINRLNRILGRRLSTPRIWPELKAWIMQDRYIYKDIIITYRNKFVSTVFTFNDYLLIIINHSSGLDSLKFGTKKLKVSWKSLLKILRFF